MIIGGLLLGSPCAAHAGPSELKDPAFAQNLALGGTLASALVISVGYTSGGGIAPVAIGGLSLIVTPSLGDLYAGNPLPNGMVLRGGLMLLAVGAGAYLQQCSNACFGPEHTVWWQSWVTIAPVGILTMAVVGGSTLHDLIHAGDEARAHNARLQLHVAPVAVSTGGSSAVGLGLAGTF
jgi:hypothetical protein